MSSLPEESLVFKASGHPSILEIMLQKIESHEKNSRENETNLNNKIKRLTDQNANFTINNYLMACTKYPKLGK